MINAIVAVNENWGIGYKGDLLEHIPEDLKYFKQLTENNIVIMGRKTWDSLPKKPLPNRTNIIISSKEEIINNNIMQVHMNTIKQIILNNNNNKDIFIIGGGQIYKQLLPFCNRIYVTKIYKKHKNIDTYFPNLDKINNWILT